MARVAIESGGGPARACIMLMSGDHPQKGAGRKAGAPSNLRPSGQRVFTKADLALLWR